jgi:ubiquitin-protein ligase
MATYESPRIRRLRSDLAALERLRGESSVLRFRVQKGDTRLPPQHYIIEFHGKSLARERGPVGVRNHHEVEIKLGASYPRTMPEIRWLTPIYHPNISEIGMVCLGGYSTHWVPSLNLDELCGMLWDMARYFNYDIRSPYNREAALWVANQKSFLFPLDTRPLRDLRAALGRVEPVKDADAASDPSPPALPVAPEPGAKAAHYREFVRRFGNEPRAEIPPVWEADASETRGADDLVIIEDEVELRPVPPRSRSTSEEIVFLD